MMEASDPWVSGDDKDGGNWGEMGKVDGPGQGLSGHAF